MSAAGNLARTGAAFAATCALTIAVAAQEPTPDPAAWRPLAYADLRVPSPTTQTYADIWKDALEANNQAYVARGDRRFGGGNAPATEAHFVIWSARRSVVLTILNTATGCVLRMVDAPARVSVKLCPLRVAAYEGVEVRTLDGGRACFLEVAASASVAAPEISRAGAYASYEPATRLIRLGLVIDHRPVDGCSLTIPIPPRS